MRVAGSILAALLLLSAASQASSQTAPPPATPSTDADPTDALGRIIARAIFLDVQVSPDGERVAYAYARARPASDDIEYTIKVATLTNTPQTQEIARFALPASRALPEGTTLVRWLPDSSRLLFMRYAAAGPRVALFDPATGLSITTFEGHDQIRFMRATSGAEIDVETSDARDQGPSALPPDRALRMRDGFRFLDPFHSPGAEQRRDTQRWRFDVTRDVFSPAGAAVTSTVTSMREYVPPPRSGLGNDIIFRSETREPGSAIVLRRTYGIAHYEDPWRREIYQRTEFAITPSSTFSEFVTRERRCDVRVLGPAQINSTVFYLSRCNSGTDVRSLNIRDQSSTVVVSTTARLEIRGDERHACDDARRTCVFVSSSNLEADSLLGVDTQSGATRPLASPNDELVPNRENIRIVRLVASDDLFWARLYLPPGTRRDTPLVIVLYYSEPGFETGTGDETPIVALLDAGLAVMTVSAVGIPDGREGNPQGEIARVERPLRALREFIHASETYGIDRSRVGLAGLSYGAEISMYAYWRSHDFRTITATTGSIAPSWTYLGGQTYARQLAERGLGPQDADVWNRLSVARNARADLPPLLWQSPDSERYNSVETWFALRRVGAPVEWLEYPDEGHIKTSPANRWWVQTRNLDWLRYWLQDYESPEPEKQDQYLRWRAMRVQ